MSPRTLPFDVAVVLPWLGWVALTAFNQREGNAGIMRDLLTVLMMWVSLRVG
jgi:hypothetical protein